VKNFDFLVIFFLCSIDRNNIVAINTLIPTTLIDLNLSAFGTELYDRMKEGIKAGFNRRQRVV